MKVIVESGSTKSEWRVVGTEEKFVLPGMNVSAMKMKAVKKILEEGLTRICAIGTPEGFYLYTAGVVTKTIREELESFISGFAPGAVVDVQNDLVGACRAALGHEAGLVVIIGTGSNTAYYDGENLSQKVYSGGFILGDDGGACVLGRRFLTDWLKFDVPEDVAADFVKEFDGSYDAIIENVYHSDVPSRYLGSFAPFLLKHYKTSEYVRHLVDSNFKTFVERSVLKYDVTAHPVAVVGGFGFACRDIIARIFSEYGIRISRFLPAPVEGLVSYHLGH